MEKEKHKLKQIIRGERFVNVPKIKEVSDVLQQQVVADTLYVRGSGQATKELEEVITLHRKWVSEIIDLSDFPHCYFTHGVTDAIHHWVMTETREWQQLEGEYEYPQVIGTKPTVCCDVPRQHMNDLGRSALPRKVDNDKPMYLSIPSAADGNYFDMGEINSPVILDCCYVGATDIKEIKIPKNTEQVFFGFSKGFGLAGQRLGLVYTKEPHKSLERLKRLENWNYNGVRTMKLIMNNFAVDDMFKRNRTRQLVFCEDYGIKPSDVWYLATSRDSYYEERRRMRWNDTARLCITPLFDKE